MAHAGDSGSGPSIVDGDAEEAVELDDGTVRVTLPAHVASVSAARRFVRGRWPDLALDVLDDVQLIVAELVSNAVKHGRPEIELGLRVQPCAVDVSVVDHEPSVPDLSVTAPHHTAASGRGLLLVDSLAHRWGVEPLVDGSGKAVWASVSTG